MKTNANLARLAIAALLTTSIQLNAQFRSFGIGKGAFFTQSSSLSPAPSTAWSFSAHFYSDAGEATTVTIDTPTGRKLTNSGDRFLFFSTPLSPSRTSLDAAYPNGSYVFTVVTGTLANASASTAFTSNDGFPSAVPYFNGDTFDRLSSYDACQSFSFTWNGFVPQTNSDGYLGSFSIEQADNLGARPFTTTLSDTHFVTVPGGTLQPNTAYRAVLSYENGRRTPNAGFGNFDSTVSFTYFTTVNFVTLPDSSQDGLSIRYSQVELRWPTVNNTIYQLQYRSALTTNQWVNLGLPILGDGTCKSVTDDIPQGRPQRFYRFVNLGE